MSAARERRPFLTDFLNYLMLGLTRGSMYALIALGYTLVYGVLQLINFAHSEVFMFGAFGSYLVVHQMVGDGQQNPAWSGRRHRSSACSSGALVGAVHRLGARARGLPAAATGAGAPKLAFLISAIGASFFLVAARREAVQPVRATTFPAYFHTDRDAVQHRSGRRQLLQVLIIVAAVVMMIFLDRLVSGTKLGRSIRGVAEDAPTAALMGIDIDKTISRTFIIGGALAGAAGFLFGDGVRVRQHDGLHPGVKAFAAAVLGGIGNIRGAMLGGLLLGRRGGGRPTASGRSASSGRTWWRSSCSSWCWSSGPPASSASGWGVRHEPQRVHLSGCDQAADRLPGRVLRAGADGGVRRRASRRTTGTPSARLSSVRASLVFLGIGVLVFLAITFWPLVRPNLVRPGAPSFLAGAITVVAAYILLRWYDPLGKFGAVRLRPWPTRSGISPIASAFFGWLHWTEFIVTFFSAASPSRVATGGWPGSRQRCASSPA